MCLVRSTSSKLMSHRAACGPDVLRVTSAWLWHCASCCIMHEPTSFSLNGAGYR